MFLQQILNGLTLGSVYCLVALGLTLVYGILQVPNFAHGAFYMAGAFVAFQLMSALGWNYWLAMFAAAAGVAVLAALAGRWVFHPLRASSGLHPMIAAIGLLLFLEASAQAIWGADFRRMPTPFAGMMDIGGTSISQQRVLLVVGAFVLMGGSSSS
jgi:branched-chain amino acid transport system permease protein